MSILEDKYNQLCKTKSDINEHLPTLVKYTKDVNYITEFGVRKGVSTTAFLYAKPKKLVSYDITDRKFNHKFFRSIVDPCTNFVFIKGNTLKITIEETDLLFIDTYHTYSQLFKELELHGNKAKKYIIFHDTNIYGEIGMDDKKPGLKKAIDEFLNINKHWFLKEEFENNNGLIVIKRINS